MPLQRKHLQCKNNQVAEAEVEESRFEFYDLLPAFEMTIDAEPPVVDEGCRTTGDRRTRHLHAPGRIFFYAQ